jgi:hypothetical protein
VELKKVGAGKVIDQILDFDIASFENDVIVEEDWLAVGDG